MQQSNRTSPAEPLAAGSVSLGLYRHPAPDAQRSIHQTVEQAQLAQRCGFDGVTLSEHHFGHPEYFPNPLVVAAVILGRTTGIWSGSLPMLLSLRPAAAVVEDVSWMSAAYPGRVVLGVAAGNAPEEYALGESAEPPVDCFVRRLGTLSACLVRPDPDHPVTRDPAVSESAGRIPVVSAARSRTAVRRAARLGLGILHSPTSSAERLASLAEDYLAAGGQGRRVLIAGAWVGGPSPAGQDRAAAWTAHGNAERVAQAISELIVACRADAVNLRLRKAGAGIDEINDQIEAFSADVLPAVRASLGHLAAPPPQPTAAHQGTE